MLEDFSVYSWFTVEQLKRRKERIGGRDRIIPALLVKIEAETANTFKIWDALSEAGYGHIYPEPIWHVWLDMNRKSHYREVFGSDAPSGQHPKRFLLQSTCLVQPEVLSAINEALGRNDTHPC